MIQEERQIFESKSLTVEDFQKYVDELSVLINQIQTGKPDSGLLSYEYYYQVVREICFQEGYEQLTQLLISQFKAFYNLTCKGILQSFSQDVFEISRSFAILNIETKRIIMMLSQIFSYLEYSYITGTQFRNIKGLIIHCLYQALEDNLQILHSAAQVFIQRVNEWRFSKEKTKDTSFFTDLSEFTSFLKDLGFYENNEKFSFVDIFYSGSQDYYLQFSNQIKDLPLQQFLTEAYRLYEGELNLSNKINDTRLIKRLIHLFKQLILQDHIDKAMNCFMILKQNQTQDLYQLYWYFTQLDQINTFRKIIYNHIQQEGTEIVSQQKDIQIIVNLINLKEDLDQKIKQCFLDDQQIKIMCNTAFEDFILMKVNSLSELFSELLDQKLTKGLLSIKDESQIVADVDRALTIFRYFTAKDIFETFYTQRLTRRILLDLSYSQELEYAVIKKLKKECGDEYTRKAEQIMKDVFHQKQVTSEFHKYLEEKQLLVPIQVQVTVISQNSWTLRPIKMSKQIDPFGSTQNLFEQFYIEQNPQKKVEWLYECSNCYLEATFDNEKYKIHASAIQSLILLYFNDQKDISFKQLSEKLPDIKLDELAQNLIPLYLGKDKENLLVKSTEAKKLNKDDVFNVNNSFKSKKRMLKINQLQKKEAKEDIDDTTSKVLHERKYMIDASIVKIMKKIKMAKLDVLIKNVMSDLRLPLKPKDIKEQIEYLIQKEYLERDREEINVFRYVA